jgi:hypothetical protein
LPWIGKPVICGWAVETSSGFACATGPTRLEYAAVDPAWSVAVTVSPIVFPASRLESAYPGAVAPWTELQ